MATDMVKTHLNLMFESQSDPDADEESVVRQNW